MRRIIILICLMFFCAGSLWAQRAVTSERGNARFDHLNVANLFIRTHPTLIEYDADSSVAEYKYVRLHTTAADSIFTSSPILTKTGDITLTVSVIGDTGTIGGNLQYGIFKGPAYSGTDPYEWNTILTFAQDTTITISIQQRTFNSQFPSPYHKLRFNETGAAQTNYWLIDMPVYRGL